MTNRRQFVKGVVGASAGALLLGSSSLAAAARAAEGPSQIWTCLPADRFSELKRSGGAGARSS